MNNAISPVQSRKSIESKVGPKGRGRKMRKNKVALIAVALAVGLGLAGVGTVTGASEIFRGPPDIIEAKLSDGDLVILRNGEAVKTLTLSEGEEGFSIETSNGGIRLKLLAGEERVEIVDKLGIGEEPDLNKLLEIAERDGRVQELITGKEYEVITAMQSGGLDGGLRIGVLTLELEETNQLYKVTMDLKTETVESIQEVLQPLYVGLTVTEAEESAIERAKEDPRVAELLEGGYEITSAYATILTEQTLTKEGEGYVFRSIIRGVDLALEKGENRTRIHVEFAPTQIIYPE